MRTKRIKSKKLTIKYWQSLERGSRERALRFVIPISPAIVSMLLDEIPAKEEIKHGFWSLVFRKIRIPEPDERGYRHYKTIFMDSTFIP